MDGLRAVRKLCLYSILLPGSCYEMKARFAAVIALVVGLAGEVSAVVVAGRISLGPALFLPGDYQFTTRHSENPTPYDAFLFSSVDANTFQIETYTVGAGVTLYALQEGAAFSPANASSLPALASNFGTGMGNQFEIPVDRRPISASEPAKVRFRPEAIGSAGSVFSTTASP